MVALQARAQPALVSGPTTEALQVPGAKLTFTFDEFMDTSAIDVTWEGAGIDASKFACDWFDTIPGFPGSFPTVLLECTYAGGLPAGVEVTYTLNKGDSGVMKSLLGDALEETRGMFRTPGGGGGPVDPDPCDPSGTNDFSVATIGLSKHLSYGQALGGEPVFDSSNGATVNAQVVGSTNAAVAGVSSATLVKPDGTQVPLTKVSFEFPEDPGIPGFPIPEFPDTFFLSVAPAPDIEVPKFDSEAAMNAAYPNGVYQMRVGLEGGGTTTVNLPLNPTGDVTTPRCGNLAALQNFDVTQPVTIQWGAFAGATERDGINLAITEQGGALVFYAPNACEGLELPATATSITVPAGTFLTNKTYEVSLAFFKATHVGQDTVPGFQEFAGLSKETRFLIGAPASSGGSNTARITRLRLESNGSVTLTLSGTLASATQPATVEGSVDLKTWTGVTAFTKQVIDGAGGTLELPDVLPSTQPTPHKFYRIRYP